MVTKEEFAKFAEKYDGNWSEKYSQLEDLRFLRDISMPLKKVYYEDLMSRGVCRALSLKWLEFGKKQVAKQGSDFWTWMNHSKDDEDGVYATCRRIMVMDRGSMTMGAKIQNVIHKNASSTGAEPPEDTMMEDVSKSLRQWGLSRGLSPGKYEWNAEGLTQFATAVVNGDEFQIVGVSGHMMARRRLPSGEYCFFDPNYGELWFKKVDSFKSWFSDFANAAYADDIEDYWVVFNFS